MRSFLCVAVCLLVFLLLFATISPVQEEKVLNNSNLMLHRERIFKKYIECFQKVGIPMLFVLLVGDEKDYHYIFYFRWFIHEKYFRISKKFLKRGGVIVKYCFIKSSHHLYKLSVTQPHHTHVGYKIGQRFHYDQFPTKTSPTVP